MNGRTTLENEAMELIALISKLKDATDKHYEKIAHAITTGLQSDIPAQEALKHLRASHESVRISNIDIPAHVMFGFSAAQTSLEKHVSLNLGNNGFLEIRNSYEKLFGKKLEDMEERIRNLMKRINRNDTVVDEE